MGVGGVGCSPGTGQPKGLRSPGCLIRVRSSPGLVACVRPPESKSGGPESHSGLVSRLGRGRLVVPQCGRLHGPAGGPQVCQQPAESWLHPSHRQQDHLLRAVLLHLWRPLWQYVPIYCWGVGAQCWGNRHKTPMSGVSRTRVLRGLWWRLGLVHLASPALHLAFSSCLETGG